MDQVLQAAGLAFQQNQKLVGFAHRSHVVPGAAENVGAVPDKCGQNESNRRIERGDREQAPPDRQHPHKALGLQIKASPRPRISRRRLLVLEGNQIEAH